MIFTRRLQDPILPYSIRIVAQQNPTLCFAYRGYFLCNAFMDDVLALWIQIILTLDLEKAIDGWSAQDFGCE